MGCLVARMGDRQEAREIAGARQRIDLPPLGIQDGVEGGHQSDAGDQRQQSSPGPSPKTARKPSSSGSPETPSLKAPGATDGLSHRIRPAETSRVTRPAMMPRGMSRLGSRDSSAASGSCSMARNSQTAKGRAAKAPFRPNGSSGPPPWGSSMAAPSGPAPMLRAWRLNSATGSADDPEHREAGQRRQGHDHVTLKDSSTPSTFSPTNTA